jgi:hypothetical protein
MALQKIGVKIAQLVSHVLRASQQNTVPLHLPTAWAQTAWPTSDRVIAASINWRPAKKRITEAPPQKLANRLDQMRRGFSILSGQH